MSKKNGTQLSLSDPKEASDEMGGLITVEAARAVQQVQAQAVLAKKFPRDMAAVRKRVEEACSRRSLAEVAIYEYSRAGQKIDGPSIRLAESLAQAYGNISFGTVELERSNDESKVMTSAWDLETNVMQFRTFSVPHVRYSEASGAKELKSQRDIYENLANAAARRLRACILGVLPGDLVDAAKTRCERTLTAVDVPLADRVKEMLERFAADFNVSREMVEARVGHRIEAITAGELVQLRKIYNSLRDGFAGVEDFFKTAPSRTDKLNEKFNGKESKVSAPTSADPTSFDNAPSGAAPLTSPSKQPALGRIQLGKEINEAGKALGHTYEDLKNISFHIFGKATKDLTIDEMTTLRDELRAELQAGVK